MTNSPANFGFVLRICQEAREEMHRDLAEVGVHMDNCTCVECKLKARGYDLDELDQDNPFTAWMRET